MDSILKKYPKLVLLIINLFIIGLIVFIAEFVLKTYFPYYTSLKPVIKSEQYDLYGWGHFPNEKIYFVDPDTGEEFCERANNKGWRGDDYTFKNKRNSFRILILGDSEAYGAIVKKDERYAKVLETKFRKEYHVEVICLSSSGYGTDQILHVLKNEGLKYNPDIVIVQFNHNDIYDNIYYDLLIEAYLETKNRNKIGMKPFYYDLDENQNLVKKENPYFENTDYTSLKSYKFKKHILQKSEILKRLYGLILTLKNRNYQEFYEPDIGPESIKYMITERRINNVELVLDDDFYSYLYDTLSKYSDRKLLPEEMNNILSSFETISSDTIEIIKTLLEDHFFQTFWNESHYNPPPLDSTEKKWQIFFRLIDEIKNITIEEKTDLAIIPCIEEGSIDFALERYAIKNDSSTLQNIRAINQLVKTYADQKYIGFINPTVPYQRAKYDAHMNKEGNELIAIDIYNWVLANYAKELANYKK